MGPVTMILAAVLAGALPAPAPASEVTPSALEVRVSQGLVTLEARGARLEDVLRALATRAGFELELRGDLSATVTRSFTDVPLDRAIQRLVRGQSLGFVYAPDAAGVRLRELWVIASAPAAPVVARPGGPERAAQLRRIGALAARRDAPALGALAATLAGDADPFLRARAAAALSQTRQPEASRALEAALGDRDASVRIQAVRGLVLLAREQAVDPVGRLLATDPDARVRRTAAYSLGALRSESARAALQAATLDADASVRRAASAALTRADRRLDGVR
jgi:hypothetical protein